MRHKRTEYERARRHKTGIQNQDLFREAGNKAAAAGLNLRRLTGQHYQLQDRQAGWKLDIHPAKQLVRASGPIPDYHLERPWTIADVVNAFCDGDTDGVPAVS